MKGLFVKDLYLLSKQKNYVLCLLAISVLPSRLIQPSVTPPSASLTV